MNLSKRRRILDNNRDIRSSIIKKRVLADRQMRNDIVNVNKYIGQKRYKFSPYVETEYVEPEPEFGICDLVDTDFEGDCEYYGNLFLTGQFAILENFETRTNDEIGGEFFNVGLFNYVEDFETRTNDEIGGEFFNVGLFNYVEDFEDGLSHGELINL